MTYRERRLARAERLRGWAEKRQERAHATLNSHPELRHDIAFITQPGRIPMRDRMNRADDRAFRSLDKADEMMSRAATIEAQAERAIYDDDPDAVDRLRAKLEQLEAERARIAAYNKACRKAGRPTPEADALLDERQRANLEGLRERVPYFLRPDGGMPAYASSNLSGNISRTRQRIAALERRAALADRAARMNAMHTGTYRAGE